MKSKDEEKEEQTEAGTLPARTEEDMVLDNEDLIVIRKALEEKHKAVKDKLNEEIITMEETVELSYEEKRTRKLKNKVTALTRSE